MPNIYSFRLQKHFEFKVLHLVCTNTASNMALIVLIWLNLTKAACISTDKQGSIIHIALKIGGGGATIPATGPNEDEVKEVTLGAGGLIEQVIHSDSNPNYWDAEKTILFNLQLFDASCFKYILGIDPPQTPIIASAYAKNGYPFFHLDEQPSGIYGELNLDSIGTLDKRDGIYFSIHEEEKDLTFPSVDILRRGTNAVTLNTVDEKTKFVPFQELSCRLKKLHLS